MDLRQFADQLDRCAQSPAEVRAFIQDFALVRLKKIIRDLDQPTPPDATAAVVAAHPPDWSNAELIAESAIDPAWIAGLPDPGALYLHVETAISGGPPVVSRYLDLAFLSDKQRRVLFPVLLSRKRAGVLRNDIVDEVRRLNAMLRFAATSGLKLERFRQYQYHLGIHGASQNIAAAVGAAGATIAICDALREVAPDCIIDAVGTPFPAHVRTPLDVYTYLYETAAPPRISSLLMKNGRAIILASDPDVAIIQSLGDPYRSAAEAHRAWESVRRDVTGRKHKVHQFVVGEVKTATDPQNLHERLALGARETRSEVQTDRFLLMAVLTKDLLSGDAAEGSRRRRRGTGLANRDVERFSDVFNLYFAWGYDSGRERHPEHWAEFKRRLSEWCGLG